MKDCGVILASFLLVYVVQFFCYDATLNEYYTALLITTTLVIFICSKFPSKITTIYASMQFLLGAFYLFLLAGYDVFPVLYDWPLNFSVILLSFELAIIVNGGVSAIGDNFNRLSAGGYLRFFTNWINQKVDQR